MKSKFAFIKRLVKMLTQRSRVTSYAIFKLIPHRRVVSQHRGNEEIFDLYPLGIFTASTSLLDPHVKASSSEVQENIELVELQPKAEYRLHYHKNSSAIIYIVAGCGTFLLGNEAIAYQAGKRIVIPAGFRHGFSTATATLFLSIQSPPIIDPTTGQIDLHYHPEE